MIAGAVGLSSIIKSHCSSREAVASAKMSKRARPRLVVRAHGLRKLLSRPYGAQPRRAFHIMRTLRLFETKSKRIKKPTDFDSKTASGEHV